MAHIDDFFQATSSFMQGIPTAVEKLVKTVHLETDFEEEKDKIYLFHYNNFLVIGKTT